MVTDQQPKPLPASITYRQLGVLALAFALGVVIALLVRDAGSAAPTAFTTTELIGFVLTVILAGASIVLAIAAIALGKTSEQAVIQRSDESIRLQNEVFTRTTEALQRIEASTGVTEKRIEDIISGRVGDISHRIAELATEGEKGTTKSFAELEEQIRESLLQTLRRDLETDRDREIRARQKERRKTEVKEYQRDHMNLMYALGNRDELKVLKASHGSLDAEGEDFFDGVFEGKDFRLGVITFKKDIPPTMIRSYLSNAVIQLSKNTVNLVMVVPFVSDHRPDELQELNIVLSGLQDSLTKRILVIAIRPEETNQVIDQLQFSRNEIHYADEARHDSPTIDS